MATTGIYVNYGGITLSPSPLVNYNFSPENYGFLWGYKNSISLDGLLTGITTTGNSIGLLTGVFGSQFQNLVVTDNLNNILYSWSGVTVESITLDSNNYYSGSFLKYNVKLISWDYPSGVTTPENSYTFSQNEAGFIDVIHKISARGVRNSQPAFQNAISFVQLFTGNDPFTYCAPILVPSGSGVLLSLSESINRADAIYGVTETYRYNTGLFQSYVKTDSLNMEDGIDAEYRIINYESKIQGSPVTKNIWSIINNDLDDYILTDIQNEFGYSTSNWVKNTYSANVDSGAATINIKVEYLSGANLQGFLDYDLTCDIDKIMLTENWKLNGEFRAFGPLEYKLSQINSFKSSNSSNNWRPYLTGIIMNAPIYSGLHNPNILFSPNCKVTVDENTGIAALKLSLELMAGYEPEGVDELKFTIDASPGHWIYDILAGANIEGSYVIQNLQTQTRPKQKFTLSSKTDNLSGTLIDVIGYLNNLAGTYVNSGTSGNILAFLTESNLETGTYDISADKTFLGNDIITSGLIGLQSIGSNSYIVPTRNSGYNFGY